MIKTLKQVLRAKENASQEENKQYPRKDWKYAVANDDTQLGYWDWVIHNLENA